MKFPESKLAHQYLDGLTGLEIGGSAHNPFGLKTRNVDYTAGFDTVHKLEEIKICGEALKVDVVAPGDDLHLPDESEDFVISSHVIEHFFDPIGAIKEWMRVVRPGGYIFIIAPHKERTFDKERPRTPLAELLDRHSGRIPRPAVDTHHHYTVWTTEDFLELCRHMNWNVVTTQDVDDKVGNGFTVVIQKPPQLPAKSTESFCQSPALLTLSRVKSEQTSLQPEFLRSLVKQFGVATFVETGTYRGDTAAMAAEIVPEVHTIELSPKLARQAVQRFSGQPGVHVHEGDSARLLPQILATLQGPALLWLDGHYSEGETARGDSNTPILAELRALQQSGLKDAIILIDDLRLFQKPVRDVENKSSLHGYPTIQELHRAVLAIDRGYRFFVLGDVALALPKCNTLEVSPVVMALTIGRLYDGQNLPLDEIFEAENVLARAKGGELEAIRSLHRQHAAVESYGLGLHYRFWHALTLFGEKKFTEAHDQFVTVAKLGFDHWRVHWYRALALFAAGQHAPAAEILDELIQLLPSFSAAQSLREEIHVALARDSQPKLINPNCDPLAALQTAGVWKSGQPLRLHLGCGENHFDGYVNIDYPPSEHSVQTKVGADVFADITGLVFPPQSVDEIRLHHVFEHFTRPQSMALLIRWHEWLKPGGKLHIETPDVMGCAEQLVSNISYRLKQAVVRHCFGSHEAHWANHYDGWHAEKYQQVLSRLGFNVECRRWRWPHEPYLANVDAYATKTRHLNRSALLAAADSILEESMVAEVASERTMWEVWRKEMRKLLGESSKPDEVVVKLQGGLGNQMFQYAAGLTLARRTGACLKLDLSFLRDRSPRPNFTRRDYCLDLFNLPTGCEIVPDGRELAKRLRCHVEQQFHFDPDFHKLGPDVYLDGYFQSQRFFEPVQDEVRRTFKSFVTPLTPAEKMFAGIIAGCHAVCLNVRRGDYVANPVTNAFHGVCDENYYQQAVALIRQRVPDAHFFIFSDDIDWCRSANLTGGAPFTLVPHDFAGDRFAAYLQLMTACRHFILPNSSFGWWAAFLGDASDKIVVVPEPWFDNPTNNTADLLPSSWIRLPKNRAATPPAPAVSVIIPCHNYAHYLPEAVASVLNQTFRNFEIIVVDDGSTDDSLAVAQRLAAENKSAIPFRVVHLDDAGPTAARRFGVAQARGQFVLPLDADDRIAPDYLAKTVPLLEADPKLGFVYVDTVYFGDVEQRHHQPEYDFTRLCRENFISYCSLMRKAAFDEVNGYDSENWGYYEDWDLWIRLGAKGWFGRHLGEPLFFYRHHFGSSLSLFVGRLDPVYKAFVYTRRPELYSAEVIASARQTLSEMPPGWNTSRPMRDVEYLKSLLAQHPDNRHVLYFLGLALWKQGALVEAEQTFVNLMNLHPNDTQARDALKQLASPAETSRTTGQPPLVSVIVPTHNRPDRLVEALRSILNQTFKDFEIIVVNDAGSDVESFVAPLNTRKQIVCLRHETNKGLAAARNTGIQAARGRYIAYLDDDDLFYPDHLQTLVDFLATHPGTVAYTDANRARQEMVNGQWTVTQREVAYSQDWDNDRVLVDNFVPVLCFMHEKSFLEKSGVFDESLRRHEDWDLWIRLSRHHPFAHIPKVTCEFSWRGDGSSMTGQNLAPFLETMQRIHTRYASLADSRPDLLEAQEAKREELQDLIQSQGATPKLKVGFLSMDPKVTACAYLRLTAPLNHLHARREIEYLDVCDLENGRIKIDEEKLRTAQVIVVQRGMAAYLPYHVLRAAILDPTVKIVFELDDALTLLPPSHQAYAHFQAVRPPIEAYLRNADLVTVSTPKLKELYSHFNEYIEVLPNTVDTQLWLPVPPKPPEDGKVRILFSGTLTHEHDLALIEQAIQRIVRKFPDRVEFLFWGNVPASLQQSPQIKNVAEFTPDYPAYARKLKTLAVDLALVPLELTPFNRSKSSIKWLEYSACKIPAIFTDIEAYNQTVEHGKTGWLVSNTAEAWYEAMKTLIQDDDLRRSIAENAHQTILARHSLKKNASLWAQAYEQVLALPPKRAASKEPQASIIIPTFNNLALTRQCLDSILCNTPQGLYEIVVVDNGSTDGTVAYLKEKDAAGQIRAVLNRRNFGFAQGCNQGALVARCPYLVFLNNDTVVKPGWLQALLAAAERPHAGVVGAKLLYPDGRIQHAGIEFINGVPDHPHRFAPADAPEVNVFREMDMVTGACFLIGKNLFHSLAGFDEVYQNGVEDVDLCLRVRAAGLTVAYEPKAVVYHHEGKSVGRFNHVKENLTLFFQNWGKSFDGKMRFIQPLPAKVRPASRSVLLANAATPGDTKAITVAWEGSFLDHGSLSHVNRELTRPLVNFPGIKLQRITNGAQASLDFKNLANEVSTSTSSDAAITVRHAWPPNWQKPRNGKLVVIQPWEFGSLPEDWVQQARHVDEFWLPSNYVRNVYVESGVPASKVVVVPNGIDSDKFHPQVAPMKLATQKKFKFLFVGGTIGRKGPDLLLRAYLENFTAADDVCLVIKDFGGQSVYAGQTFEQQIRAAQLKPNAPEILYINEELPPESLPGLYTACDCFVLPYRGEGFGLPVLEAMACGLPVIVTGGGASDDFVRDEFAYRIPAERRIFGREVSGMKLAKPGWLLEPSLAMLGQLMRRVFTNPADARERGQIASRHAHQFCSWKNSAMIVAQRIGELAGRADLPVSQDERQRVPTPKAAPAKAAPIVLPPCALVGHLGEARELVRQKKFPAAWEATLSAIAKRPFHPEAYLTLGEIAQAVGDGQDAKLCADHARRIAPGFKTAKKFLNQRLNGNAKPDWLKLPEAVQSPKSKVQSLSVCLIVKNEEKFLGQCLKSIRGVAQQIVVVDTGSTDRTIEIAREHGAEVYPFTWCDDFSTARNAVLEKATGDWILVLDADEELSADAHDKLKQAMSNAAVMAWRLPIVDVGREAEGCSYVPRLFRNAPALFYIGRVHEQVFSSIEVRREEWGLKNEIGDATLIHHGYTAEVTRDRNKIERNLGLLEQAVQELPDEPHLLMNLGLELARAGREQEAREKYREAFDILSSKPAAEIVPELRETLLTQLCTRLAAAKRFDEILHVLTSPLAKNYGGLTASLHFSLGLAHLELRQFSEAADQMRQCLAKRGQRSLAPINKDIMTAAPHHCLALSLAKAGNATAAEKAFQEGLNETGHGDRLRIEYAKFLAEQNRPVDALQRLNEIVAQDSQNVTAWRLGGQIALSKPEFLEFARDWTGEAMRYQAEDVVIAAQRAEALTLSGDTAGALDLWERVWNDKPEPAVLAALILCESVESPTTRAPQDAQEEIATSRAFLGWYQKLLAGGAQTMITRINENTEKLGRALPNAAKLLEAAMAEADQENTVGA